MWGGLLGQVVLLVFFSLLPFFYLHSPTALSVKIQSFLILSALCAYILYPGVGCALYQSTKASVYDQPIRSAFEAVVILNILKYLQRKLRFHRVNAIKWKYGYTDDPDTWKHMTVEQAQEIENNMAEWEFPRLWQFAWISDFLRVSTAVSSQKGVILLIGCIDCD